jgi:hypothetical protein
VKDGVTVILGVGNKQLIGVKNWHPFESVTCTIISFVPFKNEGKSTDKGAVYIPVATKKQYVNVVSHT